eukprot:g17848.t1
MVKKELHTPSEVLGANSKTASWQSCAATTDAAPEAVCSQVSSPPTAMAAQVMTAASNTTLASDTRELTEVETWSLGDARRIRVIDAPRVNFDLNVQTASLGTTAKGFQLGCGWGKLLIFGGFGTAQVSFLWTMKDKVE